MDSDTDPGNVDGIICSSGAVEARTRRGARASGRRSTRASSRPSLPWRSGRETSTPGSPSRRRPVAPPGGEFPHGRRRPGDESIGPTRDTRARGAARTRRAPRVRGSARTRSAPRTRRTPRTPGAQRARAPSARRARSLARAGLIVVTDDRSSPRTGPPVGHTAQNRVGRPTRGLRAGRDLPLPARDPAHRPAGRRAVHVGCLSRVRSRGRRPAGARPAASGRHRRARSVAVDRRRGRVAVRVGVGDRHSAHRERRRRASRVRPDHAERDRDRCRHARRSPPPRRRVAHARRGLYPDRPVGDRDAAAPRPRPVAAPAVVGGGHVRQPEQSRVRAARRLRPVAPPPAQAADAVATAPHRRTGDRQRHRHGGDAEPARRRRRDRAHRRGRRARGPPPGPRAAPDDRARMARDQRRSRHPSLGGPREPHRPRTRATQSARPLPHPRRRVDGPRRRPSGDAGARSRRALADRPVARHRRGPLRDAPARTGRRARHADAQRLPRDPHRTRPARRDSVRAMACSTCLAHVAPAASAGGIPARAPS